MTTIVLHQNLKCFVYLLEEKQVDNFLTCERHVQLTAFNQYLAQRSSTCNQKRRGGIKSIIEKYHERNFYCVTCYILEYRLRLYNKGVHNLISDNIIPTDITPPVSTVLTVFTLTVFTVPTAFPHHFAVGDDLSSLTNHEFDVEEEIDDMICTVLHLLFVQILV
jgi:hypothetical protein